MTARSYLFVPGGRPDMLAKAGSRGADAVIADLEDALAPSEKEAGRDIVRSWLAGLERRALDVWVRINSAPGIRERDLAVIATGTCRGLMVPKIRSADELRDLSERLDAVEADAGLEPGSTRLLPIVETAPAMQVVDAVAMAPRVQQLMAGELDLAADLGIDPSNTEAFIPLRMRLVVASAAAGIDPPVGPVSPDFRDLDALAADTRRLARMGFGSRPAIHPAQVPVINRAFTPDAETVARARRLVGRYDAALAEGRGAVTDEDGHMVDEAVVRVARRVIEAARRGSRQP